MSSCDTDKVDALKAKLKNVIKRSLSKEREVLKLRNKERSLIDELNVINAEINNFSEQLEMLKKQLSHSTHQLSLVEICKASEDFKIEAHTSILNTLLQGYQDLFKKEQKDVEQFEILRQKDIQLAAANERCANEVTAIEEECKIIERDCVVLKKRNNAILLKLRKKLLEVENMRREHIKRS